LVANYKPAPSPAQPGVDAASAARRR